MIISMPSPYKTIYPLSTLVITIDILLMLLTANSIISRWRTLLQNKSRPSRHTKLSLKNKRRPSRLTKISFRIWTQDNTLKSGWFRKFGIWIKHFDIWACTYTYKQDSPQTNKKTRTKQFVSNDETLCIQRLRFYKPRLRLRFLIIKYTRQSSQSFTQWF